MSETHRRRDVAKICTFGRPATEPRRARSWRSWRPGAQRRETGPSCSCLLFLAPCLPCWARCGASTQSACAQKRSRCRPAHRGRIARGEAHGLARDRAARCFDCMAEAGTAALAGHSPRVDAPPLRGRARRVADAGDGPAGTEKAIRRRSEPPSVAHGDGRINNIGMTFVDHSHIM